MNEFKSSVMVALLPRASEWCNISLPHLTLVYAGKKDELKPSVFNELAKAASSIAIMSNPIVLLTSGTDVFGGGVEPKVDVIKLRASSELLAMRSVVDQWNKSEYPFDPHVTIGPTGEQDPVIPSFIFFDRILVGWGNEYLTFWLRK